MALPKLSFKEEIIKNHSQKKDNLIKEFNIYKATLTKPWKLTYIEKIITEIETLLIGELSELIDLKEDFLTIKDLKKGNCSKKECNCKICNEFKDQQAFSNKIQKILNYSNSTLSPYYVNSNIKACYICNAQYTINVESEYNKKNYKSKDKFKNCKEFIKQLRHIAKYQLDHYIPKSLFPAFSISLHNLYPICANCNQIKNNKNLNLENFYSQITFELNHESIRKYYMGEDSKFVLNIKHENNEALDLAETFDFKGIYNNHLDYIEEVFEGKIKYTDSYKASLETQFEGIKYLNKQNIEDRLMLGTYSLDEGYYKRPLSKFIHDINTQFNELVTKKQIQKP